MSIASEDFDPNFPSSEDDIMITCALRFDGYKYAEETGTDLGKLMKRVQRKRVGKLTELENHAVYFALQRYLHKWGGERLSRRSNVWRIFRELFFQVAELEVPKEFQDKLYQEQWEKKYVPRLQECIEVVRKVHEGTEYQERSHKATALREGIRCSNGLLRSGKGWWLWSTYSRSWVKQKLSFHSSSCSSATAFI